MAEETTDRSVYARLKRLFSTGVIVRNVGGKKLRVADTDNLQAVMSNAMRDRYARIYAGSGYGGVTPASNYSMNMAYQSQRIMLFRDYDIMDMDSIIHSALDIYADECTVKNEYGRVLTIECEDSQVKEILDNLYYDILNIEFNLYMWIRSLCKYGDFFLFMQISPEYGIHNVLPMSVYDTIRLEGLDPKNPYYVVFETMGAGGQKQRLENFEIAHFRLTGDPNFLPYGKCVAFTTYIDTETGTKQIKDIKVGDKVWSCNTKTGKLFLTEVLNVVNSGIKELIRIETRHSKNDCSNEHPILVVNKESQQLEYKQAKDIIVGDILVVRTPQKKYGKIPKINKDMSHLSNRNGWKIGLNNIPDFITPEFARFFGFMLGDGWLSKNNNTVWFAKGVNEIQNLKYQKLLEQFSGKSGVSRTGISGKTGSAIRVDSKALANSLVQNGFVSGAPKKRVPEWVFESTPEIQLAFIEGISDADGSINIDKWGVERHQLELCNELLLHDIKQILRFLGIKSSNIRSRRGGKTKINNIECNSLPSYYIYFYPNNKNRDEFKKFRPSDIVDESIKFEPVKKIYPIESAETYDIQVNSLYSNFIANGIVIHNSMLEGGRRVYRQLMLMEDAMLIHRIMRAPEKRIFKIDIGNIPPGEVDSYIQKLIDRTKKIPFIDPATGEYNLRYNMQNILEDFYLPVRGGDSGTSIENLGGLEYNAIDDIQYLLNRLLASLKIPKAFLGYEEGIAGKLTLACVVPETKVPLLSGKTKTVQELIDDYNNGIQNYVYSIDETTKNIVPGEVEWAGFTRKDAKLVRVTLDNDEYIDCTPDHRFMMRTGEWVEAQNLKVDDSLMPLLVASNHKVKSVEALTETKDTCDIRVKTHHNFATSAGVIVHNSEDVRFARTIERIQRIVESELYKLGVVHLYAQGYKDESLISFKVHLTTPSTIYEQEKVNLWKEKVILARDILDTKMLSTDWIYQNLFNMPKDEFDHERELVVHDVKRTFRYTQVEQGMSDPTKFGFPQDQPPPPPPSPGEDGAPPEGAPPEGGGAVPPGPQPPSGGENAPGAGRPDEGINYGQDSYPVGGRNPIGAAGRTYVGKRNRENPRKPALSLEVKAMFGKMIEQNKVKRPTFKAEMLNEDVDLTDKGTFLDEAILENPSEDL